MTNTKSRKKTGVASGSELEDWHRADIKAALEKAGWSLRQLSIHHGLTPKTFQHAMWRPYPKAEKAIADVIGVTPQQIWPSRYGDDGKPNRKRGRKPMLPLHISTNQCSKAGNLAKPLTVEVDDE